MRFLIGDMLKLYKCPLVLLFALLHLQSHILPDVAATIHSKKPSPPYCCQTLQLLHDKWPLQSLPSLPKVCNECWVYVVSLERHCEIFNRVDVGILLFSF